MAIREGLKLVKIKKIIELLVFSDALAEVSKLWSSIILGNEDRVVIRDIKLLCESLHVVYVRHMDKECNCVAHTLAHFL